MKTKLKHLFIYILAVLTLYFGSTICFCAPLEDASEQPNTTQSEIAANISENFNFIKSNEESQNFIWNGTIFLYGGIALIIISVFGIIITFIPRKRRKKRRKKRTSQRSSQRYVKKR